MAQHDYNIANASFPTVRTDINNVLSAINSSNSGTSRPSGAVAGTIWLDTSGGVTAHVLKFYDGGADITLGTINTTANTVDWTDSSVTITDNSVTLAKMASGTDGNLISYDASGDPVAVATGNDGQVLTSTGAGSPPVFETVTVPDNAITLAKMASGTDGNIISYDASGNPVAVATGSAGQVLTSAGAGAPPTFATAGGGKLLQVVNAHTATNTTSNSTSYADTNLSCNITPSASSSKVLVLIQQSVRKSGGDTKANIRVYRDSTEIGGVIAGREIADTDSTASNSVGTGFSYSYLDSPSSSSQLTYKTQFNNVDGTGTVAVNYSSHQSYMTLMEIAG